MDHAEPPKAAPPKPRPPATVVIAVVIMWIATAAAAWVALVSAVATSFEVSARYAGAWSPLEFIEPALIAAVAVVFGLLAVKLQTGRDWARQLLLIAAAVTVLAAILANGPNSSSAFTNALGAIGTLLVALLLVLLLQRPSRAWCDPAAPRHSPRIHRAAHPPHYVLVSLLTLWTATALALYIAASMLLSLAGQERDLSGEGRAWLAGTIIALAIIHIALNVAFSFHRNWARWATLALAAAYTAWLITATILNAAESDPWLLPAALALIAIILITAIAGTESREWCRRTEN